MGEIDRKQLLVASLETLVENEDALQTGDDNLQERFFVTRQLAEDLGYTKIEAEIRNRNFEAALDLLTGRTVTA